MADTPIKEKYDGPCIAANGTCCRPVVARKLCALHYGRDTNGIPLDKELRITARREDRQSRPGFLICTSCNQEKPEEEFRDGRLQCISCLNIKSLSYQRSDPRARRDRRYRWYYGITIDQYEAMWDAQNGLCAICRNPETHIAKDGSSWLAVDHNHDCCKGPKACGDCVRSLLCRGCNQGIGSLCDDIDILYAAIEYLKEWKDADGRCDISLDDICRA